MKATVESPGSITGFFAVFPNGATGASLNVEKAMLTTAEENDKDEFLMNGKKEKLVVSEKTLGLFRAKTGKNGKVKIMHETKYPIGYGLGLSGAGALSLAYALDKLFGTKLSKEEKLEIAKEAEIACGTGLGDVVAEQFPGLMIGNKPYPSTTITQIDCPAKEIVFGFFSPIETKKIIRSEEWKKKINKIGLECMEEIENEKTTGKFMELSRKFTMETGLATPEIKKAMEKIPGSSMSMLGETIFIPTSEPEKVEKELKKYCKRTFIGKVATKGVRAI